MYKNLVPLINLFNEFQKGLLNVASHPLQIIFIITHIPPPKPVLPPYPIHLLDRHILRLRQQKENETRHQRHPSPEEKEGPRLKMTQNRQKHLPYHETEQEADRHSYALPRRTYLQREDLAGHKPPERAPREPERRHVDAYQDHDRRVVARAQHSVVAELLGHDSPDRQLGGQHEGPTNNKYHPPTHTIHEKGRERGGENPEGGQRDNRNPSHLLEEGDRHRHHEVRSVTPLQDFPKRGLHLLGRVRGGEEVVQLSVHVIRPTDFLEELPGVLPTLDKAGAEDEDGCRDESCRQRNSPPEIAADFGGDVVEEECARAPDAEEALETEVEGSSRDSLVGKTDSNSEKEASDHQRVEVFGGAANGGPTEKRNSTADDRALAAIFHSDARSKERGDEARYTSGKNFFRNGSIEPKSSPPVAAIIHESKT
ncbi:maintenance of mitochondrial morphology protein 1, partial [Striga asiatica]